jgi:chemotaxis protein CheD
MATTFLQPAGPSQVFLTAGDLYCADRPTLISTVLGSCVAVCLVSPQLQIAGMNHFILPSSPPDEPCARYGDVAVAALIKAMQEKGCDINTLVAKVFGGASVMAARPEDSVGERNVRMALSGLRAFGVPVVAQRTGGEAGVHISLDSSSGQVTVRALATTVST